eukprot:TRINITY_DN3378_c0_g2_i2.p1 TRINITY_DN3378_c0_g2~~TRINITY_DN3378_c0_g2_i2.p1  ORF type:complete len:249 (+),score=41.77 TRINITY_DN3378_c0_g2_i2:91-837(+)
MSCLFTEYPLVNATRKSGQQDRILQMKKNYYLSHRDKILFYSKFRREKDSEKLTETRNKYYQNRIEKIKRDLSSPDGVIKPKLEQLFSINSLNDWYNIEVKELKKIPEGRAVFKFLPFLDYLRLAYPTQGWCASSFKGIKKKWQDRGSVHNFLNKIALVLNINKPEDWYWVSRKQVQQFRGGEAFLDAFRTLYDGLVFAFPEFPWISEKFSYRGKKTHERWLFLSIRRAFPSTVTIYENYTHPFLMNE